MENYISIVDWIWVASYGMVYNYSNVFWRFIFLEIWCFYRQAKKKPSDHTCQNSRMNSGCVQGQKVPEESFGYK